MRRVLSPETKDIIKDAVDVESLLLSLGFQITKGYGMDLRAPCRLHGGDNPTAFSILKDEKIWRCFTKKCEETTTGRKENDLFSLVMKSLNVPFMEAVKYLADFSGIKFDPDTMFVDIDGDFRRQRDINKFVKNVKKVSSAGKIKTVSEKTNEVYKSWRDDYFIEQGFKPETLEKFEIGTKVDSCGVRRSTIPIRDENGELISISARRQDGDAEPRYVLDQEFQKMKVLYNLHNVLKQNTETVIVVEGFKALWAVYEAGHKNVVACMGSSISDDQVFLLCKYIFRHCVLLLDGDEAGREGMKKSISKLGLYFRVIPVYLWENISPDTISREELRETLDLFVETIR